MISKTLAISIGMHGIAIEPNSSPRGVGYRRGCLCKWHICFFAGGLSRIEKRAAIRPHFNSRSAIHDENAKNTYSSIKNIYCQSTNVLLLLFRYNSTSCQSCEWIAAFISPLCACRALILFFIHSGSAVSIYIIRILEIEKTSTVISSLHFHIPIIPTKIHELRYYKNLRDRKDLDGDFIFALSHSNNTNENS